MSFEHSQNPNQQVSAEEVLHIAALSNLHLTPDEAASMQRDLNAILDYVAQLKELDTAAVLPMSQVGEMLSRSGEDSRRTLREDMRVPSLDRVAVMSGAPETDGAFFKVPKVIER